MRFAQRRVAVVALWLLAAGAFAQETFPSKPITLLVPLSSISILPVADKVIGRAPLYQLDQLTPIARLTADPTVLAVRADSPWKTLQDFVDDARKRPGAINYGSSGNYGTMHMP